MNRNGRTLADISREALSIVATALAVVAAFAAFIGVMSAISVADWRALGLF